MFNQSVIKFRVITLLVSSLILAACSGGGDGGGGDDGSGGQTEQAVNEGSFSLNDRDRWLPGARA